MSKKRIIIDTDCGLDDALAILLAFSDKDSCDILAITCCRGNTTLDNVCQNVFRLTQYCDRKDIPVYRGCSKSVLNDMLPAHKTFHGSDGFGGVSAEFPTGDQSVQPEPAAVALLNLVTKHTGEITLVALGPLTNVMLAKRLDDSFDEHLKELCIMGGNIDALGNATASAEFNFGFDPEAAYVVMNEFSCPVKIFPWESCIRFILPWDFYEEWTNTKHPVSAIIKKLTANSAEYIKLHNLRPGYHSPDLFAMATFLKSSVVKTSVSEYPVTVELSGRSCRGLMVVDRRSVNRRGKAKGNIEITTELSVNELYELLRQMCVSNPCKL